MSINPKTLLESHQTFKTNIQVLVIYSDNCKISKRQIEDWKQVEKDINQFSTLHYIEFNSIDQDYLKQFNINNTDTPLIQLFFKGNVITLNVNGFDQDEYHTGFVDVQIWKNYLRMARDNVENGVYLLRI